MPKLYVDTDKYGYQAEFPMVEAINSAVRDLVRRRFAESGQSWEEFVFGGSYELIEQRDLAAIEQRLLDLGYRLEPSAMSSAIERPEAYRDAGLHAEDFSFEHAEAPVEAPDGDGRELRGHGDNVVTHDHNLVGTARYVRTIDKVMQYLGEGVPEDTIAIVDDSGGTLTAPILEQFKGVLCAGGTTRSHLAILTREYGIPCLMNTKLNGVRTGERVEIEVSARAKSAEDYDAGREVVARIWRLNAS